MDDQHSSHPHDPIGWLKYMNARTRATTPTTNETQPDTLTPPSSGSSLADQRTPTAPPTSTSPIATPQHFYDQPTSSPQTRQRHTIMWIALAAFVIIALYAFLQFTTVLHPGLPLWPTAYQQPNPVAPDNNPPAPSVKTFQLPSHTLIIIDGQTSDITVSAANTTTTTITARVHNTNFGPDDATTLHDDQSTNAQGITQLHISNDPTDKDIDYDITTPATTTLQITTISGSVSVTGISNTTIQTTNGSLDLADIAGTVNATTQSGDIDAHDIKGTSTLQTTNGSIHLASINGQTNASTQSGDVIATQLALSGRSTLRTTNGSIRITATLDPRGTYTLETDSGDIDLTIPTSSAFTLNAGTGSGSIHNDFNNTTVGNAPRATITVRVGNGSINIDQGP